MLTALISVNGAVAALIPVVVVVAARAALSPSQLLMPLAFSAHAGSMLALTGTPVNIIVSDAAGGCRRPPLRLLRVRARRHPAARRGRVLLIVLLGRRLLPERTPAALPPDLGDLTDALRAQYALPEGELVSTRRGVSEVLVAPRSPLIGQHLFPGMATPSGDLVVLAVQRAGDPLEGPDETLRAGDTLLLGGTWDKLQEHTTGSGEVLVVDDPSRLRRGVPLGRGAEPGHRHPGRDGRAAGHGAGAGGDRRAARGVRRRAQRGAHLGPGLPVGLVDHGRARRPG